MTLKVQKWGNSLAIRIPSGVAKDAHLREGTSIDVSADEAQIVLRRSSLSVNGISHGRRPKYTLDELLPRVTDENRQDLIDWGPPRGNEAW
jgi:antitoxin MazE